MLLFAQVVVFGMTTFWAYQVGNWFGFQKGTNNVLGEMKDLFERLKLN
ncbi:hypothetical protein MKY29_03205 [Psychrobacillus sp. FSL K6-2365]